MYTLTQNLNQVLHDADGVVFNCIDGLSYYEAYKQWIAAGNAPTPYSPTMEQLAADIDAAFDAHIDAVAFQRGYKRAGVTPSASCIGYAGYPNPYQAEAIKFGQWVADCCALLIAERAKVVAGTRMMPTPAEAIAELPPMVW
jgi:hypothetical protein